MTETINTTDPAEQPGRACGYSRCEQRIAYTGTGRPREYCGPPDRVWPDGKTCKTKATEERRAVQGAGLDGVLAAYAATSGPVLAAIDTLTGALATHTQHVTSTREGALARIEEAERTAAEALKRAAEAEGERDRAVRQAAAAVRDKDQAIENRRTAERMARDAEAERERQVTAAWRETFEHEGRRAAAEQKAADQTAAAKHALSLQQKEWERAEALATTNRGLEKAGRALELELVSARAEATAAGVRVGQLQDELAAVREQHAIELRQLRQEATEQTEALRAELAAAGEQTGAVRADLLSAQAEAGVVREALAHERAQRAAAEAALRAGGKGGWT